MKPGEIEHEKNPFVSTRKCSSIWIIWGNAWISDTRYYFGLGVLVEAQLQFLREVLGRGLRQNLG